MHFYVNYGKIYVDIRATGYIYYNKEYHIMTTNYVPKGYTAVGLGIICPSTQTGIWESFLETFQIEANLVKGYAMEKSMKDNRPCEVRFFRQKESGIGEEITCEGYLFTASTPINVNLMTQPSSIGSELVVSTIFVTVER